MIRLKQMNCLDIDLNANKYQQTSERLIANFEILIIFPMGLNKLNRTLNQLHSIDLLSKSLDIN